MSVYNKPKKKDTMAEQFGRILVIIGIALVASGLVFLLVTRLVNLADLPGTLKIETENFQLVIPLFASIVLSVILTIILNIVIRMINR